jgi:hypothetical protein
MDETNSTRDLWREQNKALLSPLSAGGPRVTEIGAELMRRTDTSPERRAAATTEQAERRAEMRRSGTDRQYV